MQFTAKREADSVVAIDRFKKETLRVFGVLEIRLSGKYTGEEREYLAGAGKGKYSVADIGTWRKFSYLPPAPLAFARW